MNISFSISIILILKLIIDLYLNQSPELRVKAPVELLITTFEVLVAFKVITRGVPPAPAAPFYT